jgi:hypothetical protein
MSKRSRRRPRKNDKKTVEQSNDAAHKKEDAADDPLIAAEIEPTPLQPKETEYQHGQQAVRGTMRERVRRIVRWINWWRVFEGVGIAAGILYASVSYLQWRDLRHNFEIEQRAWISVHMSDPNVYGDVSASAALTMTNVGKSPALGIAAHMLFEVVDRHNGPSLVLPRTAYVSRLLFPTDTFPVTITPRDPKTGEGRKLTPTEFANLVKGNSYMAIFGQITYTDQFGMHWTRFCSWHPYNSLFATIPYFFNPRPCVQYNAVGDGEPPK